MTQFPRISLPEALKCVGSGWHFLVTTLYADLIALGWDGDLHQIKEKFGELRFYIGEGTDAIHDRIEEASRESITICEICGQPGKRVRTKRGWVATLCPDDEMKYNNSLDG